MSLNSASHSQVPLWQPSQQQKDAALLTRFMLQCGITQYSDLYTWSVANPEEFWPQVWQFCQLQGDMGSEVLVNAEDMLAARFFPNGSLNYTQNILRPEDEEVALYYCREQGSLSTLTHRELYQAVARLVAQLKQWDVGPGDRVAGVVSNTPEAIIAFLATASIGAIWSSCSPDFGSQGVVDRFGQISPKVMIYQAHYTYNGKEFHVEDRLSDILSHIPSITHAVVIEGRGTTVTVESAQEIVAWDAVMQHKETVPELVFEQFSFAHPLYILFSSGTTGVPKCITHSAGGALLQHMKEHQLHCDIRPGDRVFYYTTCGWMMWNWLVSALASRAAIVLYDGSPMFPHVTRLFDLIDAVQITHFGTSAKYIDYLRKEQESPRTTHALINLRMILSTGSPLVPESFDYVYADIKEDVCLASISGGTDIVSCFALGNPILPVWRGQLQTRGLGMRVEVFDDAGGAIVGEKGELVCTAPFPCQPIGFWGDDSGERYRSAYFSRWPNVWCHGDFVLLTPEDGLIIHGRSDAVLNPGGVRIGTAEIYRQVEGIPEVLESIAVGQTWQEDIRVILFVRLRPTEVLNDILQQKIKTQIRRNTTPRHVPAVIRAVQDIPKTKSGKIAEIAVRQAIHGEPIRNLDALANPESLEEYQAFYRHFSTA